MKFELTPQELELVMRSLTQQPWHMVQAIIPNLIKQANEQNPVATPGPKPPLERVS